MTTIRISQLLRLLSLCFALESQSASGGDLFRLPKQHFEHVGRFGNLEYFERWAEIPLAEGKVLPLVARFDSMSKIESPLLGCGWSLLPFDSYIVPVDDFQFDALLINGRQVRFFANKAPGVYTAEDGSIAEVEGDNIVVKFLGGCESVYHKGRLVKIADGDTKISMHSKQDGSVQLNMNGKSQVTMNFADTKGDGKVLLGNEEFIAILRGKRARIGSLQNNQIVEGLVSSVVGIRLKGGESRNYEFDGSKEGVTGGLAVWKDGEKVEEFEWDGATGKISKDGANVFEIVPPENIWQSPEITKFEDNGKTSYWFRDNLRGFETRTEADGSKISKYWFVSGKMKGFVRKVIITDSSGVSREFKNAYDLSGMLLRSSGQ